MRCEETRPLLLPGEGRAGRLTLTLTQRPGQAPFYHLPRGSRPRLVFNLCDITLPLFSLCCSIWVVCSFIFVLYVKRGLVSFAIAVISRVFIGHLKLSVCLSVRVCE